MNALLVYDIHEAWAWFVIVANALAGIWSLVAHRWPVVRSRALWWFTVAAQSTMFVQVVLGIIMLVVTFGIVALANRLRLKSGGGSLRDN